MELFEPDGFREFNEKYYKPAAQVLTDKMAEILSKSLGREPFFNPSDFTNSETGLTFKSEFSIAKIANAKLDAAIGPTVYGHRENDNYWSTKKWDSDEYRARLFNVQPVKSKCYHKTLIRIFFDPDTLTGEATCKCGQKLKADWKEVE